MVTLAIDLYRFATFVAEPQPGDVLLRHDVDLSLEAVEIGRASCRERV